MNNAIEVLGALGVGGFISGITVNWINHKLEQDSENKRKIREQREKQYSDFLNNLMGFFQVGADKERQKKFVWDVNTNAIISVSDEVYRLARDFIDTFDQSKEIDEPEREKIYSKLIITIRNEINRMNGKPPTNLREDEIKVMQID